MGVLHRLDLDLDNMGEAREGNDGGKRGEAYGINQFPWRNIE